MPSATHVHRRRTRSSSFVHDAGLRIPGRAKYRAPVRVQRGALPVSAPASVRRQLLKLAGQHCSVPAFRSTPGRNQEMMRPQRPFTGDCPCNLSSRPQVRSSGPMPLNTRPALPWMECTGSSLIQDQHRVGCANCQRRPKAAGFRRFAAHLTESSPFPLHGSNRPFPIAGPMF